MDAPKCLMEKENIGVPQKSIAEVNSTMVKMNTLVTAPQTAQKKMTVLGVPGVHGLNVLNPVGLECKTGLDLFSWRPDKMAINVLKRMPLKASNATTNPVQFANGMIGLNGCHVKKVSGQDLDKLNKEAKLVPKNIVFTWNRVLQLIASGAIGVVGVFAPKTVVVEHNEE